VDPHPSLGTNTIVGDGTALPFSDASFDLVASLDTLEHLPLTSRLRMIDECVRVSCRGVILIAPFSIPETRVAEDLLFEFIRRALGAEHEQLREHVLNGLPELNTVEAHLRDLGYPYLVRPSGYVHRWLVMMLAKHYLLSLPNSEQVHEQLDRYYNTHYFDADQRAPGYRNFIFIAKQGDQGALARVGEALGEPETAPTSPVDDLRDLAKLGIAIDLLTLQIANSRPTDIAVDSGQGWQTAPPAAGLGVGQSTISCLERSLEEAEKRASQYQAELASANDLNRRIASGKVMRLMNATRSILRRGLR
jgi:hypothetical protein